MGVVVLGLEPEHRHSSRIISHEQLVAIWWNHNGLCHAEGLIFSSSLLALPLDHRSGQWNSDLIISDKNPRKKSFVA